MTDDPPDADGPGRARALPGERVHSELVEALILLLIEKGVLTRNDALSIVQTVADVQRGRAVEDREPGAPIKASLLMLQRMYVSFEAIEDRPAALSAEAENVHQLRPPIYGGDRPEFPRDE